MMKFPSIEVLIVLAWSLTAVDVLLTAGRFAIHYRQRKTLSLDVIFNGIALLLLIAFMITWQLYIPTEFRAQEYAAGLRHDPVPGYDPVAARKLDSANLIIFWCMIYAVKASFLALYWRVFDVEKRWRVAWRVLAVYMGVSFVVSVLAIFWHCGSPATFIDEDACGRWRHRALSIGYMVAVLHILGDIMLMILPLMMLRSLQMRLREKVGLAAIFALVLVEVAFTIVRVVFTAMFFFKEVPDRNVLWTTLDAVIAVMVCSLPCYRNLFSSGRNKPVVRTPDVSFHSSMFPASLDFSPFDSRKEGPIAVYTDELDSAWLKS